MLIIDQKRPGIFNLTISGYELATLISSARWVADGAKGELTDEAVANIKQIVTNYDKSLKLMVSRPDRSSTSRKKL